MILDIYKDSFEYASKNVKNLLILGVFYLFSFLIIPIFLILGYNYRIVKIATEGMINGDDKLPEFQEWTLMFVEGIKCFVVYIAYAIIPIIIFTGILFGCSQINNIPLFIIGFIVSILILIIFTLYSFLAISHMATNNDSIKSAFDIKGITNIAKSIGWGRCFTTYIGMLLIACVITVVVAAIVTLVLMVLGFATISAFPMIGVTTATGIISTLIINFVIIFIVMPYLEIFQSRCQGLLYNIR